jgi:predicted  nucleic acid-binding Zn-ribbon protein
MKKLITLLLISSFTLFNSCDQSNSQLFDLVLEIKSQNDQLLNEVKTLQIKSDLLIAELRLSAAKQEELLLKVTELQDQLSTILSQINSLNQQLKAQDADIQLIKNQLADLQTQYQGIFKQLEELQKLSQVLAEIEKMKTQINQLDTRYTTILAGLVQNKQQLDALKTQITSAQTQLADNLTKISQLISQLGDQGVVLSNILKQIELIKNNNEELIKLLENLLLGKSPIPTNGLIAWYPFNGNANDESGNGNHGTVYGALLSNDRFNNSNKSYLFDGIDDFISTDRKNLVSFSISFWFILDKNKEWAPFVDANNANFEILAKFSKPAFIKWINTPSNYSELLLDNPVELKTWINMVCTFTNGKVQIFQNGSLTKVFDNVNFARTDGKFFFGNSKSGTNQFLEGKMDDIGIWNRVLTAEEVSKIYLGQGF